MFQLVETIENHGKTYTAVPASWEDGGILYWPAHLKDNDLVKMLKNANVKPSSNWSTMKCATKATVNSYLEGRKLEKVYASFVDTDAEESYMHRSKTTSKKGKRQPMQTIDLNTKVEDVLNRTAEKRINEEINLIELMPHRATAEATDATGLQSVLSDVQQYEVVEGGGNNDIVPPEYRSAAEMIIFPTVENEMTARNNEFESIKNEIMIIKPDVASTKKSVQGLHVKLDHIIKLLGGNKQIRQQTDIVLTKEVNFPLKDVEEISNLNSMLNNEDVKNEVINRLSAIGGTTRTEDGSKLMYKIMDFLFLPEALNKYSWTGSSKSGEKKQCFQKLTHIVDMIFEVISLADCRHSKQRNEEFLKNKVLKHAGQRLQRKR